MRRQARTGERSASKGHDLGELPIRLTRLQDDARPQLATSSVDEIAGWQERRLKTLLSTAQSGSEAELVRAQHRTYGLVQDIRRLLPRSPIPLSQVSERHLKELLAQDPATATAESAWLVADSLEQMLPQIADDGYLGLLLEKELVRDRNRSGVRWSNYFPAEELEGLVSAFRRGAVNGGQRDRAVEALLALGNKRRDEGAHHRARVAMRARSFLHYAFLLGGLALALGIFLLLIGASSWTILAAATAGAVGGTLSGTARTKGVPAMNELRSFRGWKVLQVFIGASAGLFAFMLLSSDILRLPGTSGESTGWAAFATYGFIAGFAEPYFLGVVGNIAGGPGEGSRSRSHPNR